MEDPGGGVGARGEVQRLLPGGTVDHHPGGLRGGAGRGLLCLRLPPGTMELADHGAAILGEGEDPVPVGVRAEHAHGQVALLVQVALPLPGADHHAGGLLGLILAQLGVRGGEEPLVGETGLGAVGGPCVPGALNPLDQPQKRTSGQLERSQDHQESEEGAQHGFPFEPTVVRPAPGSSSGRVRLLRDALAQGIEGLLLELTDPLGRDPEALADPEAGALASVRQAVAVGQDPGLASRWLAQALDQGAAHRGRVLELRRPGRPRPAAPRSPASELPGRASPGSTRAASSRPAGPRRRGRPGGSRRGTPRDRTARRGP